MSAPLQNNVNMPQVQTKEYKLEGGVTFIDKTNGIAKVIFSKELTIKLGDPTYQITINGKKLIFPVATHPSDNVFLLMGSQKITIKAKEEFFKITEVDVLGMSVFYVDPRNTVEGVAFDTYNDFPKEITLEEAIDKFAHLKKEHPKFQAYATAYNRHGVGVFGIYGIDSDAMKTTFYWASPSQEKVKLMDCDILVTLRDGGTKRAKTKDGFVNFLYRPAQITKTIDKCFINAEPATLIKN